MNPYPPEYFARYDDSDDALFYAFPRKVVHIDAGAIATLRGHFAEHLPPRGVYLDLMSSWRSHLPDDLQPTRVVGLGMNADEMADNPQLDKYVVHNLNQNPRLPFDDGVFDAAFCTVSVQYLQQPAAVFAEVARVVKTNAPFIVSFSNRCFPTKAVAVWTGTTDRQHVALVAGYFEEAGAWADIKAYTHTPAAGDPLYIVSAKKAGAQ